MISGLDARLHTAETGSRFGPGPCAPDPVGPHPGRLPKDRKMAAGLLTPRQREILQLSLELMGAPTSFPRNAEIYGEAEPADYLYKVVSGAVRTYKVLIDGRRQIAAFYLPGDMFGLEPGEKHAFSAEAVTDAKVLVIKRSLLLALAAHDSQVARQLWALAGRELQRAQNHVLLLGRTAPERVASFLLEMADRIQGSDEVELPMSRQDVADYLGLTIETVSRMLTRLESASAIALLTAKRIVLRNRAALRRLNS
jgi:CRP/FNR family transcriptional regulator, nitrogen fixation regulation protein